MPVMRPGHTPLYMALCNYVTPLYLAAGAALMLRGEWSAGGATLFTIAHVYLLPPLLCRALLALFGRPLGEFQVQERGFRLWWLLTQLQILYARLPVLEELLRLVPGLYSLWLTLWGGRASPWAYWSPGVVVADRYLLRIGPGAVLGGGCRIGGHLLRRGTDGTLTLTVAPMRIDGGALIGLHAGVGPGCHVHAGETVPAGRLLRPFTTWQGGRGQRPG